MRRQTSEKPTLQVVKAQEVANGLFTEFNLLKTKKTDIIEEIKSLSILVLTLYMPPKSQIIWDYSIPNAQIKFGAAY